MKADTHVTAKGKIGVTLLQAKGWQRFPATPEAKDRARKDSPGGFRGGMAFLAP